MLNETSQKHGKAERYVVPERVPVESGESRTVVSGTGCVRVQDLRQSVRTGIRNAGGPELVHNERYRREHQESTRQKISTESIAIFTSYASIFFPRYSGVRPTIRPAMKTAKITKTMIP